MWMLDSPPSPDLNPYDALQITPEELLRLEAEEHHLSDTSPPHDHQHSSSSSSSNNDKKVPLSIRTIINDKKKSTITTAPLSPKIKAFSTTPTSKTKASSSKHSPFFTATATTTTTTGSPSAKFSTGCIKDLIATAKIWAPHAAIRGKLYKNSPLDVFYEALTAAKTNIASCNPDQLLDLSFTLRPILCHALSKGYKRQQIEDIANNIMYTSGSRLAKVAYLAALSLSGEGGGGGEVLSPPTSLPPSSSNYNTANKQVFHTLLRASCRFATHVCLDNGIPIRHHFLRSLSFFLKQFIPDMSLKTIGEALSLFNALKWRPFEAEDISMSVLQLLAKQQTNYKHGTANGNGNGNGTKTPTCNATNGSSRVNSFTPTPTPTPTPTVTSSPPLPPFSFSSSSSHWNTNSSNIREFVNIMDALVRLRCIENAHNAGAFIDLVARNVLIMDDSDSDDDLEEKFTAMASFVLDEDDDDGTDTTTTTTPLPPPPPVPNLLARLKNDVASYCSIIHSCALLMSQHNTPNNNNMMSGRHIGLYQSIFEQFLDFASTVQYDHDTTTGETRGGTGFMMYIDDIPFSSSIPLAAMMEKTIVVASFVHHKCVHTKPSSDLIAASRNLLRTQSSLSSNNNGGGQSSSPSPPLPPTTNSSNSIQSPLMNMAKRKMHLLITDILPRHSLSSVTCEHGSSLKYINRRSKSTTITLSSREKLAVCIHGDEEYLLVDTTGWTRYGTTRTTTTTTTTTGTTKYSSRGNTVSRMSMLSGEALGREACLSAQGYYVLSIDLHSLTTLPLDVLRDEVKMMLQSGSTSAALSSWC